MALSVVGEAAAKGWGWLENQYPYVKIDISCIMPNHTHAIIQIHDIQSSGRGGSRTAPTARKPLGRLVGAYKAFTTKRSNRLNRTPGSKFWQRSFYDHIIRDEHDLHNIRFYIHHNPLKWETDQENPDNFNN